ncbi:putative toxin-antitoxin system toxin component, PIN family [Planktothricoides raciborskii]|uniref:Toxin-antitoxin system toxin component, PIN family n=1 Tax=Planktothricoides raciborskii GIHE-MW2 TaxID=2792601 RepID=A0AAU8JA07_9CYAN
MKKVIIDTNILISAAISGRKPEEVINFIIASSDYEWIVSPSILDEYVQVLNRPKLKLNSQQKQRWLDLIDQVTILVNLQQKVHFERDPKDAKLIECAIAADADFLITGDRDFEEIQEIGNTLIISVSLFKTLFIDKDK